MLADVPVGQHTQLRPLVRGAVGRCSSRPLANAANVSLFTDKAARKFRAGDGGIFGTATTSTIGKRNKDGYHTSGWGSVEFQDEPHFTACCYLNPVGHGNFTIVDSGDPFADAIVHGALLSDPKDCESALRCVEDSREIIQGGFPEDFGVVDMSLSSLISLQDWVHASTGACWHFVGGSAVGSVVDGDFKLIGDLKGVRVIDASVIPKMTASSGPSSSAHMIAEFASDKLVEEHSSKFGAVNTAESFMLALSIILIFAALAFGSWVWVFTRRQIPSTSQKRECLDSPFIGDPTQVDWDTSAQNDENSNSLTTPTALLSWSEVSCSYPSSSNKSEPPLITLQTSFGELKTTQLTAVMGSSGSGKSALLDIVSGRKTLGEITGSMSVAGEVIRNISSQAKINEGTLRSLSAHVPQQEVFFPTQTAEEAVEFFANLKSGKDPSGGNEARHSHMQSLLQDVGLRQEASQRCTNNCQEQHSNDRITLMSSFHIFLV